MRRTSVWAASLLLLVALAACGGAAPKVEWILTVGGAVSSPLSLSYANLAAMKLTDLKDILMERSLGEDTIGDWSGVALSDILSQAGAGEFASITAVASDGYAIEISKAELEDSIVALKENGKWIAQADPDKGPIRLVVPHTPANRWVFQLQELQVNAAAAGGIPVNAALKITGNVDAEIGWTDEKLRSMDPISADYTDKSGEMLTYLGVSINDLLAKAGPKAGATLLTLVAADGYSSEVELAEVLGCGDCIVAFDDGGLRTVMPGFSSKAQVKDIVEIQVQ